jgi:hypothetical protein
MLRQPEYRRFGISVAIAETIRIPPSLFPI